MRNTVILAALLAAAPLVGQAQSLSYTYVEAGWTQRDLPSPLDEHANGGYLRGSWAVTDPIYVFAGFSQVRKTFHDYGTARIELRQPELGIGYRQSLAERLDFTADIAFQRYETRTKLSGYDALDGGMGLDGEYKDHATVGRLNFGLRGKPSERTEAWIKGGYLDGTDDQDGEFVGNIGGQFNITPTWGVVGEAVFVGDDQQWMLGARASF